MAGRDGGRAIVTPAEKLGLALFIIGVVTRVHADSETTAFVTLAIMVVGFGLFILAGGKE